MNTRIFLLFAAFLATGISLRAQYQNETDKIADFEKEAWLHTLQAQDRNVIVSANNLSDIQYCRMHWTVNPDIRYITGEVMTVFSPFQSLSTLEFDFSQALTMNNVLYHGQSIPVTRVGDVVTVHFPSTLPAHVRDSLTFMYQGVPTSTGFGSFEVKAHDTGNALWTLSEPYGAMEWWPCKQSLNDKIDSIDVFITCPEGQRASSNGLLVSETTTNGQTTAHWKHRYPIAAYLVCMAVSNYSVFSMQAPYQGHSTTILNYVYPEFLSNAQAGVADNVKHLQLYDELFELYPFQNEKYGHTQFGWGGGMEHQTMTFVGGFSFELLAHELAHHWFGDKITCGSWRDIWLNEGFATYCSGLCYEHLRPASEWYAFKKSRITAATDAPDGSVYVDDTTSVSRIFSGRLSYAKGAMVLHMLRWVMGDDAFFAGLKSYLSDPALAYKYAHTTDLQAHLEAASGMNLNEFFADWVYGQGYPSYTLEWDQTGSGPVHILLHQNQSHPSVSFFEMPVPVRFYQSNGQTLDVTLNHQTNDENFTVPGNGVPLDSVVFDPDLWLISRNNQTIVGIVDPYPAGYSLIVAPNPVSGDNITAYLSTTDGGSAIDWRLISNDGKLLRSEHDMLVQGQNMLQMSVSGIASGTYILEAIVNGKAFRQKIVVQ